MRAVQVTRGLELELAGSASTWVFSIVNNGFLLIYMCGPAEFGLGVRNPLMEQRREDL